MAGSSMTIAYDDGSDGSGSHANIRRVIVDWTSDDSDGTVSGTTRKIVGRLIKAVTNPGAAAPTTDYDIVLTDDESVNVLAGCDADLTDRHTSNTEEVYFLVMNHADTPLAQSLHPVVCDKLTVAVTAAGNSKVGRLILYYQPL